MLIAYNSQRHEDLSDLQSKLLQDGNLAPMRQFLKLNLAATNTKHEWVDKPLKGFKTTLAAGITDVATTLTIDNANIETINGFTMLLVDNEVIKVTAGAGTTSLTVARGQVGSSAAAHTAGTSVIIFSQFHAEGADVTRSDHEVGSKKYNLTQIFRRELNLSATSQAVKSVANDNAMANQIKDKMKQIEIELFNSFIHGRRYASGDESSRLMAGLKFYITASRTMDRQGDNISKKIFDKVISTLLDSGVAGNQLCCLTPNTQVGRINDLKVARIISGGMSDESKVLRQDVEYFEFAGARMQIIRCPLLAENEMIVFDKTKAKLVPLQKRIVKVEPLGKTGDAEKSLLVGEYTAEIRNGDEAFFWIKNLGT